MISVLQLASSTPTVVFIRSFLLSRRVSSYCRPTCVFFHRCTFLRGSLLPTKTFSEAAFRRVLS